MTGCVGRLATVLAALILAVLASGGGGGGGGGARCPADVEIRPHTPSLAQVLPHDRTCCEYMATFVEDGAEPVARIPTPMLPHYTLWNTTQLEYWVLRHEYAGGKAFRSKWPHAMVEELVAAVRNGRPDTNYPQSIESTVGPALDAHPIDGKRGCVIGSETPWLEAYLLARGAVHITTIEYGEIETDHEQLTTLTPSQVRDAFMRGSDLAGPFDFCFSYSSLEHSGLGRYGDRLAPFGDLEMIARVRCMLRSGGLFFFGVPSSDTDCLVFNAHRIYGPRRLAIIAEQGGWRRVSAHGPTGAGCDWHAQPVHVLKKRE